jgi:hypothetical protein
MNLWRRERRDLGRGGVFMVVIKASFWGSAPWRDASGALGVSKNQGERGGGKFGILGMLYVRTLDAADK